MSVARPARRRVKRLVIFLVLVALALAGLYWRGDLRRGVVFAREWITGGAGSGSGSKGLDVSRLLVHGAERMDLRITALTSGTLESASSAVVLSEVEGEVAILSVVPEGTRVEKGDVVVELDSSTLRARETEQLIVVENARSAGNQLEQAN